MSATIERLATGNNKKLPKTVPFMPNVAKINSPEDSLLNDRNPSTPKSNLLKMPDEYGRIMKLSIRFNELVGQYLENGVPIAAITTHLMYGENHGRISDLLDAFYEATTQRNDRTLIKRSFFAARRSGLETVGVIRQINDREMAKALNLGTKSIMFLKHGLALPTEN